MRSSLTMALLLAAPGLVESTASTDDAARALRRQLVSKNTSHSSRCVTTSGIVRPVVDRAEASEAVVSETLGCGTQPRQPRSVATVSGRRRARLGSPHPSDNALAGGCDRHVGGAGGVDRDSFGPLRGTAAPSGTSASARDLTAVLGIGQPALVDPTLRRRLGRWFAVIELTDADVPPSVITCLRELVEMLDIIDPSRLDHRRSSIRQTGHGWIVRGGGVEIHLAHEADECADVDVVVGDREAIVSWLSAHEHVSSEDGNLDRPWMTVVIDVVAAVMRGEYEVESHFRGKRLVKTRIVDVADRERPRHLGTTSSLFGWVPRPGQKRVEVQRLDYGVRGPGAQSSGA
jgi:hypothetical protein